MGKRILIWSGMVAMGLALTAISAAQDPAANPAPANAPAENQLVQNVGERNLLEPHGVEFQVMATGFTLSSMPPAQSAGFSEQSSKENALT